MFFEITGNRIYADNQPYLSPQLGKNFFLTGKIITAGRDARSLRPDCAQVVPRLHPGCVRAPRAREHYVILGIFSCRPRPCGTPYKRGRDATCCVRKREDELAGQARKDTDSEEFANDVQIGAREVM